MGSFYRRKTSPSLFESRKYTNFLSNFLGSNSNTRWWHKELIFREVMSHYICQHLGKILDIDNLFGTTHYWHFHFFKDTFFQTWDFSQSASKIWSSKWSTFIVFIIFYPRSKHLLATSNQFQQRFISGFFESWYKFYPIAELLKKCVHIFQVTRS